MELGRPDPCERGTKVVSNPLDAVGSPRRSNSGARAVIGVGFRVFGV